MKRVRTVVIAGLLAGGCSVLTPRDEFTAYRVYRYEPSAERRTQYGADYLARYPSGRFRAEVQREVGNREEDFWSERRATLEGLQAYLSAYPNGVHVAEARNRLGVYEGERNRLQAERRAREEAERQSRTAELRAQSERNRLFVRTTVVDWLRLLGGLEAWGEPLGTVVQRNTEFNTAFQADPGGQCRGARCRKLWTLDYTVPVPGRTARQRQIRMSLDLIRPGGRLMQAGLIMQRRGLTSWFENEQQTFVETTDADARSRSVRWSMDQLKALVATVFPEARETPPGPGGLAGPEPEMEGEVSDAEGDATPPPAGAAATSVPPQPLGMQWSYLIGCGARGGAQITMPAGVQPPAAGATPAAAVNVRSCIRIDAYSAPDIEGVSTDEGLRISYLPAAALGGAGGSGPARPGRPARPARPAAGARPAPAASPAPAAP